MALLAPALGCSLNAAELFLDFGPNTPTATGWTNAPYAGTANSTQASWNVIGSVTNGYVTEPASLKFADGNTASGVTFDFGATDKASASTLVDFSKSPNKSAGLDSGTTEWRNGLFASGSPTRDAVFVTPDGTAGQQSGIGIKIGGLAAGSYDVYIVGVNANAPTPMKTWAFSSTDVSTIDFNPLSGFNTISNAGAGATTAWTELQNYSKFTVTLDAANPYLTILTAGNGASDKRAFLNAVQIVSAIPEPSTYAAIFGAVALAGVICFRARRRMAA